MRAFANQNITSNGTKPSKGSIGSLRYMFGYLAPYKLNVVFAFLALLFTSSAVLSIGYGLRLLVDEGIARGDMALLNKSFFVLMIIVIGLAISTYARYFFVTWIGERVVSDIRKDAFSHLISQDVAYFESRPIGDILSRITTDTTLLQTVVGSSVSVALRNIILLVGGCVMLVFTSIDLSVYVALTIPIVIVPIVIIGKKVRKLSRLTQEKLANINSHAEESFSSIRTVQSLTLEDYKIAAFEDNSNILLKTAFSRISLRSLLTAIVIVLVFGAVAFVLWIGGKDVINGNITAGDLSSFLFYAVLVAASAGAISEVVGSLQLAAGAAERLMELKQVSPTIKPPANPTELPEKLSGNITFDNVEFFYPSRKDYLAVNGFSLEIRAGEHVAIVGRSGAGKTTLFQLLGRSYDVTSGGIYIDEVNIKDVAPRDLRSHIGIVPQDSFIFSTSAYDNIAIGKVGGKASYDEVIAAAKQAEAYEFINDLPDGFDNFLGEKGVRLSGGQKQRIAIARMIIRNPDILLLDEATSSLDLENEQKIQTAMQAIMKGRTTLVIAHRLATVRDADRIVVLDKGQIVDIGTHDELLGGSEIYQKLANEEIK